MKVTNILIYSRSNAVITVHQLVQDIALTWADTPSLLPLPRFEKNSMKPMPNLGLIVIPSEKVLHAQDPDSSEIPSFTTYHLTSDLNIIGDMYAKEVDFVHDLTEFGVDQSKKRNDISSNPDSDSESSDEDWISEREIDFTEVAKIVLPTNPPAEVIPQVTLPQLKRDILEQIESRRELPFETMYPPINDPSNKKVTNKVSRYGIHESRCVGVDDRANSSSITRNRDEHTASPGSHNSRRGP